LDCTAEEKKKFPTNCEKLKGKLGVECKIFRRETVNSYKHTITCTACDALRMSPVVIEYLLNYSLTDYTAWS